MDGQQSLAYVQDFFPRFTYLLIWALPHLQR